MTRINEAFAARMDRIRKGEKNDKGFTLIELLVVVIIIGILAAIAIPVFLNQRESAWRSSVESDVKNAQLAVETFSTTNNGSLVGLPAGTYTEDTAAPANMPLNVSAGNEIIIVAVGNNGYTITGTNENLDESIEYTSATGRLGVWG